MAGLEGSADEAKAQVSSKQGGLPCFASRKPARPVPHHSIRTSYTQPLTWNPTSWIRRLTKEDRRGMGASPFKRSAPTGEKTSVETWARDE